MQYLALIQYSEKESVILMTHHICRSQNKLVSELPISGNYTTVLEVKCFNKIELDIIYSLLCFLTQHTLKPWCYRQC